VSGFTELNELNGLDSTLKNQPDLTLDSHTASDMARLTEPEQTLNSHQASSQNPETDRRTSYAVGEPDSAPELIKFITCNTVEELGDLTPEELLLAAQQGQETITHWEATIIGHLQRIKDLEDEVKEQRSVVAYLEQRSTQEPARPSKSMKIPDPEPLSDGMTPTFENWKVQIEGKFSVNADHFATEQAKMIYLFGRTTSDAQAHLQPRFSNADAGDQFTSAQDMIDHLATIYVDPYKVQNARHDFRRLIMKTSQTFTEFYTRFLHLAGVARIPSEDWRPELYDKLTLDLQKAVLPTFNTLLTYKALADQCLLLDQGLKRIRERSERIQKSKTQQTVNTPAPATTTATASKPLNTPPSTSNITRPRPTYDDPDRQALSRAGACFVCRQPGHFANACPQKRTEVKAIEFNTDSLGKANP
jgi:hypothetical protein